MRYHYKPVSPITIPIYGVTYICDHPVYNRCTLYTIKDLGLAVIQQRQYKGSKVTIWTNIDPGLANDIYLQPGFKDYFFERAKKCEDKLYPTVTVRQIMWALKMKPLPKQRWETVFDRKNI